MGLVRAARSRPNDDNLMDWPDLNGLFGLLHVGESGLERGPPFLTLRGENGLASTTARRDNGKVQVLRARFAGLSGRQR